MGFIRDRISGARRPAGGTRSALEQAHEPRGGAVNGSVTRLVTTLLNSGIDGHGRFSSAQHVADAALLERGGDVEGAIDEVISDHLKLASASGFLTNLGGFAVMAVALPANVFGFYVLATRMAAAVARLRGYDPSRPEVRTAVLLSLVGADAQDLLAKAGLVAPSGRLAGFAAQRLPGPALIVVNKAVGFRILSQAGRGVFARFGRAVPIVGGVVGAGMDLWLIKQLADHVRTEFPREHPAPATDPAAIRSAAESRSAADR